MYMEKSQHLLVAPVLLILILFIVLVTTTNRRRKRGAGTRETAARTVRGQLLADLLIRAAASVVPSSGLLGALC